jgi:hypothetical protein
MTRKLFILLTIILSVPAFAATPAPAGYHMRLLINPAAPFPVLSKLGEVELDVYPGGVRGSALLIRGLTLSGTDVVRVELPLNRIATEVKISDVKPILARLAGTNPDAVAAPLQLSPTVSKGTVKGIPATRYTIILNGPANTMHVWTTDRIPRNAQLLRVQEQFLSAIAQSAVTTIRRLPGTPVYIELNTVNHKKLALMKLESFQTGASPEEKEALTPGRLFVDVPVSELIMMVLGVK